MIRRIAAPALCVFVVMCLPCHAQETAGDTTALFTCSAEPIECELAFLRELGLREFPPQGYLLLDDFSAFFLQATVSGNVAGRENVFALPKTAHALGKPIEINLDWSAAANPRRIKKKGAWRSLAPCRFTLTPSLRESPPQIELSVEFSDSRTTKRKVAAKVSSGASVLVLVDTRSDGSYQTVLLCPRIIDERD